MFGEVVMVPVVMVPELETSLVTVIAEKEVSVASNDLEPEETEIQ